MNLTADIDLDVTVHLGHLRNVDICSRGVYYIRISLLFGCPQQTIIPIGLFSAPSRLDSFVRDITVPASPMINPSTIEISPPSFCSRCFVIRYKDENHELNEGAHWRLTIPELHLNELHMLRPVECLESLVVRFELMFADLLPYDITSDLLNSIEDFIPPEPQFTLAATQDVQLQHASSAFHHYYPVRFDKFHFMDMDVMFHTAVTAIRYTSISASVVPAGMSYAEFCRILQSGTLSFAGDISTENSCDAPKGVWYGGENTGTSPDLQESYCCDDPPSPPNFPISSSVAVSPPKQPCEAPPTNPIPQRRSFKTPPTTVVRRSSTTDSRSSYRKQYSAFSETDDPAKRKKSLQSVNSFDCTEREAFSMRVSGPSGLSREEVQIFFEVYACPLIVNHKYLIKGTEEIVKLFSAWKGKAKRHSLTDTLIDDSECYLIQNKEEIVERLLNEDSIPKLCDALERYIEEGNAQFCSRWSIALSALPKVMTEICTCMKRRYTDSIRAYWKGQTLVHTCSTVAMKKPHLYEEAKLAMLLRSLETEHQENMAMARGLRLFNPSLHAVSPRLPILIIQQYMPTSLLQEQGHAEHTEEGVVLRGGSITGCDDSIHMDDIMRWLKYGDAVSNAPDALETEAASRNISCQGMRFGITGGIYNNPTTSDKYATDGVHLIVLQHGFQGNSYDMRLLRNALHVELPNALFLLASSNEANSGDSLKTMGANLAQEVISFCKDKCPRMLCDEKFKGRVTFIGHSVGGLIIRKALESDKLQMILNRLDTYISLASPHLGTLYADSQLVSTGMWALLKIKKSPVLQELVLKDSIGGDFNDTELYRLSENGVLQHFRRVVFVSSPLDMYVPEYSARVQVNPKAILNPQIGYTVVTMAANLIAQIEPEKLLRITLHNNVAESGNVDRAIGRAAHICYLESPVIAEQLVYTLYPILK